MRVDSLDWMAGVLAGLGCGFTIRAPEELRRERRELAPSRATAPASQTAVAAAANAAMLG